MKKYVPGLALLATAAALFLSACGGGDGEPSAQEPATAAQGSAKTIEIDATDFAFTPSTMDIDVPGTYTFWKSAGWKSARTRVSHYALTTLSSEQAYAQLLSSRRVLERRLGHRVPWLAYPIGDYDSRIETLARRAGYRLAVTTEYGATQSARRPLALRRLRVSDTTGVSGLAAMLGG